MSATYGVTPDTLGEYVRISFGANTGPTESDAEAHIARLAKRVDGRLARLGYSPSSVQADSTSVVYAIAAEWISLKAAARLARARRGGSTELARDLNEEADSVWSDLVSQPQDAGDDLPDDSVGLFASEASDTLTESEKAGRSFGQRLQDERLL